MYQTIEFDVGNEVWGVLYQLGILEGTADLVDIERLVEECYYMMSTNPEIMVTPCNKELQWLQRKYGVVDENITFLIFRIQLEIANRVASKFSSATIYNAIYSIDVIAEDNSVAVTLYH